MRQQVESFTITRSTQQQEMSNNKPQTLSSNNTAQQMSNNKPQTLSSNNTVQQISTTHDPSKSTINNNLTFSKKLSDPPTPTSEQSSALNQEQEETDAPTSIAERSLMAKKHHTTLRDNAFVIDRSDPNSPLYSLTSFQELKLKPELLNGKSIVQNKNCRLN